MSGLNRKVYGLMGAGVALAFFGHGVLGAKGEEKFIGLVQGTYDKVLGGSMSHSAATTIVKTIGYIDIALAIVFLGIAIAALREQPIAYSRFALYLYSWAMVWGFLTALSRFTAVMNGAATWDVVERGPNYLLPAALVYVLYRARHGASEKAREPVKFTGTPIPSH